MAPPARPIANARPVKPSSAGATISGTADDLLGRGQAAFEHGDYPESVRRGREAVAAGAALGGHLLVGDAYYRLERYVDAMREYQAALARDPASTAARRGMELTQQAIRSAH